jgi:carbon-monoxide dehydrogenase large subunit
MAVTEKLVGQPVLRKEDASLLRGQGSFVDNMTLPGMVHMAVVRSPFAHAKVVKVDVSQALEISGVIGAWSAADLAEEWAGPLPMVWPITEDIKTSDHWPLTGDKARFQGDGVAVVLAESRGLANDGAEAVQVEYDPLPPVLDLEEAAKDGGTLVHDELGTNAVVHWSHGGGGDQSLFESAPVKLTVRYEAPSPRRCRRWASSRCGPRRRSRTSRGSRWPGRRASPNTSCASWRPTSAARSAAS